MENSPNEQTSQKIVYVLQENLENTSMSREIMHFLQDNWLLPDSYPKPLLEIEGWTPLTQTWSLIEQPHPLTHSPTHSLTNPSVFT
jgi:hypothetical protein